jgi:predicted O-methyltransferase YrrM
LGAGQRHDRSDPLDPALTQLLDDLHRAGREYDERRPERRDRWRNVEPETAQLLSVLIRALAPPRILELGTSNGYSTIWLAEAAVVVGATVTSVEIDPDRCARALINLVRAGLEQRVELRVEDAATTLSAAAEHAWDLIFLDAERPAYAGYWPDLRRVLAPGGLLVVDNVLSHAGELGEFRALIAADPAVTEALAPTGAGALLVVKDPPARESGPTDPRIGAILCGCEAHREAAAGRTSR